MKFAKHILFILFLLIFTWLKSEIYFIAPDGLDSNPGSINQPLASIQKGQDLANPGDTVYIRGGTYYLTEDDISRVYNGLFACITFLDKSGTPGNTIKYWAYPGENPVFNHSAVKPDNQRNVGIYVTGSYLHIRGLEITGIQVTITSHTESYCIYSYGNHNIFELLKLHDGQGTGLRHRRGGNNLFLNCDSYRNHDYTSEGGRGVNTDGFGCHPDAGGTGNIFRGCRAWFNSDDGYDVIGAMEAVVFENCWAMYAGYSTSFNSLGDGNGFKAGGHATLSVEQLPDPIPRHTVRFCLSVGNKASGFYANHHIGGINWYNNTAYRNRYNYNMLNRLPDNATDVPGYDHRLRNNLGYKGRSSEIQNINYDQCDNAYNYFDLDVTVSDDDFLSLDESLLQQPREQDGSLPDVNFMKLSLGSDLVDKGEDIGFFYSGRATDLGAFEQFYYPFPSSNAIWYQYYYPEYYWEPENPPEFMIFGLMDQDTIIYGKKYNKVFRFYADPPEASTAVYVGAIREDSSKKVYYRGLHPFSYPVSDTGDILLYDFSVFAGDTIRAGLFTSNEYLVVSELDTIRIGDSYRKRIHFKDFPTTKWIEGIGNERGLLFYSGELQINGLWGDLVCFRQEGSRLYHNPAYANCFEDQVNNTKSETRDPEISISPNPAKQGYTDAKVSGNIQHIQLISARGKILLSSWDLKKNTLRIRTGDLPSGIYFIRISDSRQGVHTRKLIVSN